MKRSGKSFSFFSENDESKGESSSDSQCRSFIFGSQDPEDSYQKLKACNKDWLVRESRVNGMLTVDYRLQETGEYHSIRYAFLPDGEGWVEVPYRQIKKYQTLMRAIRLDSVTLWPYVTQLLALIEERLSLTEDTLLIPAPFEQTRNNVYSAYEMLLTDPSRESRENAIEVLERIRCPITLNEPDEMKEPALLFGRVFEKENIERWVGIHGKCPVTKKPARLKDIRPTTSITRLVHRLQEEEEGLPLKRRPSV